MEWIVALGIAGYGYFRTRKYVRERLRFVDAVHRPAAPVVAGVATTVLTGLVVSVVPFFGPLTAVLAGIGIGVGVSQGARDSKRLPTP